MRFLSSKKISCTLRYAHMEQDIQQPEEMRNPAPATQEEQPATAETGEQQEDQQSKDRRNTDLVDAFHVRNALFAVGLELLMRRNPQAREAHDEWIAMDNRRYRLQKDWEKDILAQEGEEG